MFVRRLSGGPGQAAWWLGISHGPRGPVVIDTDVFGACLTPRRQAPTRQYRSLREGRSAIISFVAVAELRFCARLAGWSPGRLQRLEHTVTADRVIKP